MNGPFRPVSRRQFARLVAASPIVAASGVALSPAAWSGSAADHRFQRIEPKWLDIRADTAESEPTATGPFRLAGVTWENAKRSDIAIQIRTQRNGHWSRWLNVPVDEHGPDADSAESAHARGGTEPLFVAESTAVQVRARPTGDKGMPEGLRLDLVHPGSAATDDQPLDSDLGVMSLPTTPKIYRRDDWGADESIREPGDPEFADEILGAFVHHTAGTNDYSSSDVPGIIRGIYVYHVQGRGWRDIGYNFLIDKFGRIWEGRYGGYGQMVIGAHTQGYNAYSTGVAALGSFSPVSPTSDMLTAYSRILAWKFAYHGVNPRLYAHYPEQTLNAIAGHRNASATECPGDRLYAKLSTIRSGTLEILDRRATPSTLTLSGTRLLAADSAIVMRVRWRTDDGDDVTGTASLQRKRGSSWVHNRTVDVVDGRAFVPITLGASNVFRLKASRSIEPYNVELGYSNQLNVTAVPSTTTLRLTAPETVPAGGLADFTAVWETEAGPVTGHVDVERFGGSSWTFIRRFAVTNGSGTGQANVGGRGTYRLRAHDASSPSEVDLTHPVGTSNEVWITVS